MSITVINYGDQINPGTQPVLVFPIVNNELLAAIDTTSAGVIASTSLTESGGETGTIASTTFTDSELGIPTDVANITDPGAGKGLRGLMRNVPIAGQLANLAAFVSKDGGPFAAAGGVLAEIANGYYSYIPATTETNNPPTQASSNTGTVVVRIRPTDPLAITNFYIEETMIVFRLKFPGFATTNMNPGQSAVFQAALQPVISGLEDFIRDALRDLLGNQMTNKPTFRRDQ